MLNLYQHCYTYNSLERKRFMHKESYNSAEKSVLYLQVTHLETLPTKYAFFPQSLRRIVASQNYKYFYAMKVHMKII